MIMTASTTAAKTTAGIAADVAGRSHALTISATVETFASTETRRRHAARVTRKEIALTTSKEGLQIGRRKKAARIAAAIRKLGGGVAEARLLSDEDAP